MKKYYTLFLVLVLIYIILSVAIPPDKVAIAKYNLSTTEARLLSATIVVPLLFIWAIAFYGFVKFKAYATLIHTQPDGQPLNTIADGLFVLAIGSPLSTIFSSLLGYFGRTDAHIQLFSGIFNRYLALLIALAGFFLIKRGATQLLENTKTPLKPSYQLINATLIAFLGGIYILGTFSNSARATIYHLPDVLIVATILVPYLYTWYNGIQSSLYIYGYEQHVTGVIYKKALRLLAIGIIAVIGSSILTQGLTILSSSLQDWGLRSLLVLIYILLIMISIGYILIALGAKKLKKIEEIV